MTRIKIIGLFSLILIFLSTATAQENYFDFKSSSWASVLKKAKSSRKPIFIQTYSEDCDACIQIANEVWTDKELAELYSKSFILYKFSSNSKEAKSVKSKLGINANPTSVFVDGNGKVIHKYVGYVTVATMNDMAVRVNTKKHTLAKYKQQYKGGKGRLSPDELLDYAYVLLNASEDSKDVSDTYFKTQTSEMLGSDINIKAMLAFTSDIKSREFEFMARSDVHQARENKDNEKIMLKVEDVISIDVNDYLLKTKNYEGLMDTLMSIMEFYNIEYRDLLMSRVELDYSDYVQPNPREYFMKLEHYMNLHFVFLSPSDIGDKCQRIADECTIDEVNNSAINWMQDAVAMDPRDLNLQMTYVDILVKNRHFSEAKGLADQIYMMKYGETEYGAKKLEEFHRKVAELESSKETISH